MQQARGNFDAAGSGSNGGRMDHVQDAEDSSGDEDEQVARGVLARPEGLEPPTVGSEDQCSIH